MSNEKNAIIIDPSDNVATAIDTLEAGDVAQTDVGLIELIQAIPFGHKFALVDIPRDAYVVKYGARIGRASADIRQGEHVHVHNVLDITDEVRKEVTR